MTPEETLEIAKSILHLTKVVRKLQSEVHYLAKRLPTEQLIEFMAAAEEIDAT